MGTRIPPLSPTLNPQQSGLSQLIDDLQSLSEDHSSADLVFICGRPEDEERRIYAHRIILMARCKSFKTANRGEICRIPGCTVSIGTPTVIRLPHVNSEVFRQFLLYVYTSKIVLEDSCVFEMLMLAQDMGLEKLCAACEDHIISTVSVENACTFLTAASGIHEKVGTEYAASFIKRCIIYIGEHASECVKTNSFLNLSKDALVELISSDYCCLEEEEVWRSVLEWAKYQAGVTQPTAHWTDEERGRVCQHLSGVICHVRLLLIDSQVFAEEVEPTGAVPIELLLERYRYAALHLNKTSTNGTGAQIGCYAPFAVPSQPPLIGDDDKRLQPRLAKNLFASSQILKNDKIHFQNVLNSWYGVQKQTWRLAYRASTHGFSSATFHRFCDGVAPCFVIAISSRGQISGGFTDVAWAKTNRKGGYIHSENAFLFSLNPHGTGSPIKFDIIKKPYAICYHADCGPIFGAGADLLIANNCNANTDSYSNLPHSYDGNGASYETLFGDYNFTIIDYEVYTLANTSSPEDGKISACVYSPVNGNNNSNSNSNNKNNNGEGNVSLASTTNMLVTNFSAVVNSDISGDRLRGSTGFNRPKYKKY